MVHDFANRHNQMKPASGLPRWVFFVTGFTSGFFLAFLIYLWKFVPGDPEADTLPKAEDLVSGNGVQEIQWDFYEIFPSSEVPIVEEYNPDGDKVRVEEPHAYLLQAGSFSTPEDANKRRAELLLLGLDVFLKEVEVDDKRRHRVLVGPLHSELELNRAQDKLAEAQVESIALRVSP